MTDIDKLGDIEYVGVKFTSSVEELAKLTCLVDKLKFELKVVEARHMMNIAPDKINYPNDKAREAGVLVKCESDPYYKDLTDKYQEAYITMEARRADSKYYETLMECIKNK